MNHCITVKAGLIGIATLISCSLASRPAAAQMSNTNCTQIGAQLFCNSTAPNSEINIDWSALHDLAAGNAAAPAQVDEARRVGYEIARARWQQRIAAQRQALQRSVGAMVSEGRCADARATALRQGDFELAGLVAQSCAQAGGAASYEAPR